MARRRLTIKHLDPWSMLKFSILANIVFVAVALVGVLVAWFIVDRLGIVDQVCGIAIDIGFSQCGLNTSNLFRALTTVGALWVVVQTAMMVFMAFLYNLIADLTGGLSIIAVDEAAPGPRGAAGASRSLDGTDSDLATTGRRRAAVTTTADRTAAMPAVDDAAPASRRANPSGGGRASAAATGRQRPAERPRQRPTQQTGTTPPGTGRTRPAGDADDELFGDR